MHMNAQSTKTEKTLVLIERDLPPVSLQRASREVTK